MEDKMEIVGYHDIKLEKGKNGFILEYCCMKKNPMMPESTFGPNVMHKEEEMVFEISKTSSFDDAFDRATQAMKKLYKFNEENKKSEEY